MILSPKYTLKRGLISELGFDFRYAPMRVFLADMRVIFAQGREIYAVMRVICAQVRVIWEGIREGARRIFMELDEFASRRPIDLIAANRPILILGEPQKMEGKATKFFYSD